MRIFPIHGHCSGEDVGDGVKQEREQRTAADTRVPGTVTACIARCQLQGTTAVRSYMSGCDAVAKITLKRYQMIWTVRSSADGHDRGSPVAVRTAQFTRAVRSRVNGCDSMGTVVVRSAQSRRNVGSKSNGGSRKGMRPGLQRDPTDTAGSDFYG